MTKYNYTSADFKSDQEVKWCPGCGDHAMLNAVQRALPEVAEALDKPHEKFVFVSGIGCSSRFIYYMRTFGFHIPKNPCCGTVSRHPCEDARGLRSFCPAHVRAKTIHEKNLRQSEGFCGLMIGFSDL